MVSQMLESGLGYEAARNEYVDMSDAGIIAPAKVVRIALENAVSVASVLLLAEATLTEIPRPGAGHPPMPELETWKRPLP